MEFSFGFPQVKKRILNKTGPYYVSVYAFRGSLPYSTQGNLNPKADPPKKTIIEKRADITSAECSCQTLLGFCSKKHKSGCLARKKKTRKSSVHLVHVIAIWNSPADSHDSQEPPFRGASLGSTLFCKGSAANFLAVCIQRRTTHAAIHRNLSPAPSKWTFQKWTNRSYF